MYPRNEFIKYFIPPGEGESRSDKRDGGDERDRSKVAIDVGAREYDEAYTKGYPLYNSPLRNNPLQKAYALPA